MSDPMPTSSSAAERTTTPNAFWPNLRANALSGFLVFLIALPLCLAIAKASNYPPICGIWTAVVGGVLTCFLSNANLTIKGPAAGLIVIAAGAVSDLGREFVPQLPSAAVMQLQEAGKTPDQIAKELEFAQLAAGHRLAIAVGVAAGLCQVAFGLLKFGAIGDFFPLAAVHGMLASIGVIIMAKQSYAVLGATPPKNAEPLELIAHLPKAAAHDVNPEIFAIGALSLLILFLVPALPWKALRRIPAPLLVLLVAVPLGSWFDLEHEHTYLFHDGFFHHEDAEYRVGPKFLVDLPNTLKNPSDAFFAPDFRALATATGLKYLLMFALIASLESLLSAKAIDLIDPWKRKTDLNRDLLACGAANALASACGGLPMISEIVRSKANVDNGATNRYSNLFHAVFLLSFALLLPDLLHRIPLAALGAMLVYTGFRLAHPREFLHTFKIGPEQLVVFVSTIVATLATDLLIGIFVGVGVKLVIHLFSGVPPKALVKPSVSIVRSDNEPTVIYVRGAAAFTNWLSLRSTILRHTSERGVVVDLSGTRLVDHSTLEKLHDLKRDFARVCLPLEIVGIEGHRPLSRHPLAARWQRMRPAT
jgi:MFS superfamily sulfate permease-like transporter